MTADPRKSTIHPQADIPLPAYGGKVQAVVPERKTNTNTNTEEPAMTKTPLPQRFAVLLALLGGSLFAGAAQATLYTDRSSFEAAAQSLNTTGFEGLIGTPGYPANYLGVGTFNGTSAGISVAIPVAEVKFVGSDSSFGYGTYLIPGSVGGGAYSLNGSTALVMHPTSADITLPTGISAFGTDFGFATALNKHGPVDVTFHLHDGTTESLTLNANQFFAYAGKTIDSIHFDARGLHYPDMDSLLLDNVSIGVVPEPATYVLMLAGVAAIGFGSGLQRRRKADLSDPAFTAQAASGAAA